MSKWLRKPVRPPEIKRVVACKRTKNLWCHRTFETVNALMGVKNIHFGSTATNSQERRKLCSGQILRFIQQHEAKLCHLHIVSSQQ